MQQLAPSERELSTKLTEGECEILLLSLVIWRDIPYSCAISFRLASQSTSLSEGGKSLY